MFPRSRARILARFAGQPAQRHTPRAPFGLLSRATVFSTKNWRHEIEELNLMLRKWRLGTMAAKRSGTRLWKEGDDERGKEEEEGALYREGRGTVAH